MLFVSTALQGIHILSGTLTSTGDYHSPKGPDKDQRGRRSI